MSDPSGLMRAVILVPLMVTIPITGCATIYKRGLRSVTLWALLIVLLPLAGSLLYGLSGINRYR